MRSILPLGLLLLIVVGCHQASRGAGLVVAGSMQARDGVSIAYDTRGAGDTALVFIHCWCCDRSFWREQLDAFARDYRVVAVDLPGHGMSGSARDAWSIAGLGQDICALVDKLRLKRVILIGHSMGGPVALEAARCLPDRVLGVVAVDTLHDAEFEYPEGMTDVWADRFEADFEGQMRATVPAMFPDDADPALVEWVIVKACATNRQAAVALLRDFPNLDVKESMSAAGVPIRAINAAAQPPRGMRTAVETNRKYADYDGVLMEGVGHYLMLERPEEFNARLRVVLEELSRS